MGYERVQSPSVARRKGSGGERSEEKDRRRTDRDERDRGERSMHGGVSASAAAPPDTPQKLSERVMSAGRFGHRMDQFGVGRSDRPASSAASGSGVIQRAIINSNTGKAYKGVRGLRLSKWYKGLDESERKLALEVHRNTQVLAHKADVSEPEALKVIRTMLPSVQVPTVSSGLVGKKRKISLESSSDSSESEDQGSEDQSNQEERERRLVTSASSRSKGKIEYESSSSSDESEEEGEKRPVRSKRSSPYRSRVEYEPESSEEDADIEEENDNARSSSRTSHVRKKAKVGTQEDSRAVDTRFRKRTFSKTRAAKGGRSRKEFQRQFRSLRKVQKAITEPVNKGNKKAKAKDPRSISVAQVTMQVTTRQGKTLQVPLKAGGKIASFINKKSAATLGKGRLQKLEDANTTAVGVVDSVKKGRKFTSKLGLQGEITNANAHAEAAVGEYVLQNEEEILSTIQARLDKGDAPVSVNLAVAIDKPPCSGCHEKLEKTKNTLFSKSGVAITYSVVYPKGEANEGIRKKYFKVRQFDQDTDEESGTDPVEEAALTDEEEED